MLSSILKTSYYTAIQNSLLQYIKDQNIDICQYINISQQPNSMNTQCTQPPVAPLFL